MNVSQQQIAYILSLIEHKNFGKAAEACFVTQPTLSMQVKKAEESLGFQVFNRNRNPLELTSFGEKLVPILYDMQAEYEKIKRLTQKQLGKNVEEIKIGIIPTVASYLVPKLFQHKNQFVEEVKFEITELKTEDLLEDLQLRKIDFGILAGPVSQENLHQTSLFNEEILIYCPELKKQKEVHVNEIKFLHPWLLNGGNCLRTQMIQFCNLSEINDQNWNYEGGNLEMLIKMVDEYGGYTLIPSFYVENYDFNKKHLHSLISDKNELLPARNIIGISSQKNSNHPILKQLNQFIKLNFANLKEKKFEILAWK
ncbi:MAG: LysR family transcriptional regulator [Flavobacteriia bacterium]|jgi:LysR family hydrogen peroxide-inducible transcriptional activator